MLEQLHKLREDDLVSRHPVEQLVAIERHRLRRPFVPDRAHNFFHDSEELPSIDGLRRVGFPCQPQGSARGRATSAARSRAMT
jgi:hypothetical protein